MNLGDYKDKLAAFLVKKDRHLALNIEQAEQLVSYVMLFTLKDFVLLEKNDDKKVKQFYSIGKEAVKLSNSADDKKVKQFYSINNGDDR